MNDEEAASILHRSPFLVHHSGGAIRPAEWSSQSQLGLRSESACGSGSWPCRAAPPGAGGAPEWHAMLGAHIWWRGGARGGRCRSSDQMKISEVWRRHLADAIHAAVRLACGSASSRTRYWSDRALNPPMS